MRIILFLIGFIVIVVLYVKYVRPQYNQYLLEKFDTSGAGWSFTFTPCGAKGANGPTKSQMQSYYGNDIVTKYGIDMSSNQGIQTWTVPATGSYKIIAGGAAGGDSYYINNTTINAPGGKGIVVSNTVNLNQGDIIKILVGQKGTKWTGAFGGGTGGGGTFVVKSTNIPLLVAGAGGGGGQIVGTMIPTASNGIVTTAGNSTLGANWGNAGGTNGNAGPSGWGAGLGPTGPDGGAGFTGNASNTSNPHQIAYSFVNGGVGSGISTNNTTIEGGFGGGGGMDNDSHGNPVSWGGGGAGGYSGGAGGTTPSNSPYFLPGGGGGSYDSTTSGNTAVQYTSAIPDSKITTVSGGYNTGDGFVIISSVTNPYIDYVGMASASYNYNQTQSANAAAQQATIATASASYNYNQTQSANQATASASYNYNQSQTANAAVQQATVGTASASWNYNNQQSSNATANAGASASWNYNQQQAGTSANLNAINAAAQQSAAAAMNATASASWNYNQKKTSAVVPLNAKNVNQNLGSIRNELVVSPPPSPDISPDTSSNPPAQSPLVLSAPQIIEQKVSLVQPNNIKLYLNSFNIQSTDPRNTITVIYSFNSNNTTDLTIIKSTGIESLLQSILNLAQNTVIATNAVNDTNNNTLVTFNITYPQLSQSTAALTNLDSILHVAQNKEQILQIFQGATAFTIVGKPKQGNVAIVNNTYWCDTNTWCDYNNQTIKYNIKGDNVPTSINSDDGLGLLNIQLYGPPSNTLSLISNNNILDSFTIIFYMKINSLTFNSGNSIIWYQMYAETPNMVRIAIYQQDSNNSIVEVIIGNQNINYRWVIPNTTLMSNGYVTTYTFIYNKPNSIFYFYIGSTENVAKLEVNTDQPIVLGLTPIAINKGAQSMDAQLYVFLYYNSLLSKYELQKVSDYFNYEMGGVATLQLTNLQSTAQIQSLQAQNEQAQGLQSQLDQCKTSIGSYKKPGPSIGSNPWVVNYNKKVDPLMEEELNQCSPLKLKELNLEKPVQASSSIQELKYTPISVNTPKNKNDANGSVKSKNFLESLFS